MRRLLNRWLDAWGEHISRHGWVDPTGTATPPVPPPPSARHDGLDGHELRVPQPVD